jgi:O-antigen/teichoic acid export membrane protein
MEILFEKAAVNIYSQIKIFFSKGHARTLNIKRNIALSFVLKGGTILTSLILVPMTINYVNPTQYGIWLTLSSLIAWFSFFDIGLGNGLKNKLSEAISNGNELLAKTYVSSSYYAMCIISVALMVIFLVINHFINWSKVLNAPPELARKLSSIALIVFFVFSVQFVLQLLNVVSFATQKTMLTSLINFLGNLVGLTAIFVLTKTTRGSLVYLCLSIGISPLLMLSLFTIFLYSTSYKKYAPSFKLANLKYAKEVLEIGLKFFIIQLGLIFFYNADNIIISQVISPAAVTPYNVAYKYFGVITMISGIIMTPFWPAFTEAHVRKDYQWIKSAVSKLEKSCILLLILSVCMLLVSNKIYHIWVGNKIVVPFSLSIVLAFYTVLNTYRTIFCYYSNAISKIRIQLLIVSASGLINIPMGIFLGKLFGSTGVILSTTILCVICALIEITQYRKLINLKAEGLWNK